MICHVNKIIFIHIPCTAGSSVEYAFTEKNWFDVEPNTKHLTWREAKYFYSEYWDSYLKFSVVRNPFDWITSLYYSDYGNDRENRKVGKNFREWLIDPYFQDWEQQGHFQSQSKIIGEELNHIIRYENLNEEFYKLFNKNLEWFHVWKTKVKIDKNYKDFYDVETIELATNIIQEDLERFDYEF